MRVFASFFFLAAMLFSAGCQSVPMRQGGESLGSEAILPATSTPPGAPAQVVATPDRMEPAVSKTPERVPPTEEPAPVTGEVPSELLDSISKDLTERTGAAPGQVSVLRAQAVIWNDGSLGCPQPGMMYTQSLVNGYWVELEIGGKKFDYRASDSGYFFLCQSGFPPSILPVTPDS